MITHKITRKWGSGTEVYITIEYTDGRQVVSRNYRTDAPTDTWVQKCVDAEVSKLEKLFAFDPTVADSSLDPDPGPSKEEQAYQEALRKLELARPLLDLGAISIQDKDISPVIATIVDYVRKRL